MANIKPYEIMVINSMDQDNRYDRPLSIGYFQTIGHLRQKIAKKFGHQINEFNLHFKQNVHADPDTEDDIMMKDIQLKDSP